MAKASRKEETRILVVDDDDETRKLLVEVLEKRGYSVQSAQNGEIAWGLLNGEPLYNVVISDLNMPGLDGLQLLRLIREGSLPVEVILWTCLPGHGVVSKAHELRTFAILPKPHKLEELLKTVELALREATGDAKAVRPAIARR